MHSIRKPRVFLSHSKKDVEFVRRLETDLRAAQCEPWIDDTELRAGQPWLDQIFASGIPSCEVVLCYFTPNSAESQVFMQELDARLIEKLHNARVSLLIYVQSADLRSRLRLDLQSLQVPELNDQNYAKTFPRVVAEIWRTYAESLVQSSIETEKVKRLEAELRIKQLESEASASAFTASEQTEFKAIWSRIDRKQEFLVKVAPKSKPQPGGIADLSEQPTSAADSLSVEHRMMLDLGALFQGALLKQKFQPSVRTLTESVRTDVLRELRIESSEYQAFFELPIDIEAELLRYGFVQRQYAPPSSADSKLIRLTQSPFKLMFTSKFDRFGFWVEHNFAVAELVTTYVRAE